MDGERFDRFARVLASGIDRRGILRVIAGGCAGAALSLLGGVAEAGARCRRNGHTCSRHAHCCSGFCPHQKHRRSVCAACESEIVCGNICCPPEALNGCTEINGPEGPIIGCLCPEGTLYDRGANRCQPCGNTDQLCRSNDDCCSDSCCEGTCCGSGEVCSVEGKCVAEECCSPPVTCGSQTTLGLCCTGEKWLSECCCDSGVGKNDGVAHCCTPGVDCLIDLSAEELYRRCPRSNGAIGSTGCDPSDGPLSISCCAWDMVPCCGFVGTEFEFRRYVCAWDGICTDAICKDRLGNAGEIHCC